MVFTWLVTLLSICSFFKPSNLAPCSANSIVDNAVSCLRTDKSECTNSTLKIAWDYVNLDTGTVNFNILGLSCLPRLYYLRLYRIEDSKKESCIEFNKEITLKKTEVFCNKNACGREGALRHSYKPIDESKGIPCEQVQNVTFDFIYTGQYVMDLREVNQVFYSEPVCFVTNFKRESVFKQQISIFSKYHSDLKQMQHTVSNFSRLQVKDLKLVVRHSSPGGFPEKKIIEDNIKLNEPGGMKCSSMAPKVCDDIQFDEERDQIDCFVNNVTSGNQTLYVVLGFDPCKEYNSSVWEGGDVYCRMHGQPEEAILVNSTYPPGPPGHDTRVLVVLGVLFIIFAVVIIAFTVYLIKKCCPGEPPPPEVDIPVIVIPEAQPEIYLAYARDCPEFMKMMVIFRNLLKRMNYKVYDCFDPDYFEEIAGITSLWPRKCISNENVKVLLIETKCAKLHYQALMKNMKIMYREPTALDEYFVLSLKTLLNSPQLNSYPRVFVACVSGFTSEEDKLPEITPFRRYDIPDALNDLLHSLYKKNSISFPENKNLDVLKLEEAIKNLVNYSTSNKDYLKELLQRIEVNKLWRFFSRFRHF